MAKPCVSEIAPTQMNTSVRVSEIGDVCTQAIRVQSKRSYALFELSDIKRKCTVL